MSEELYQMTWRGIDIEIKYNPNWSSAMNAGYGFIMTHMEIKAQGRVRLPMTETGYRSHFTPVGNVDEVGGAIEFVRLWLEDKAQDKSWIDHADLSRQSELF